MSTVMTSALCHCEHLCKVLEVQHTVPVSLVTPVACYSHRLVCFPPANYVSGKQHKQAGAKLAYGNMFYCCCDGCVVDGRLMCWICCFTCCVSIINLPLVD